MEPGRSGRAEELCRLFEAHYADMVRLAFRSTDFAGYPDGCR